MSDKVYYPMPECTHVWFYYMCHYIGFSTAESMEDIGDEWLTYCAGGEL